MPAAIPTLAVSARRQVLQAVVDPIGYHRRCFTMGPSRPVRLMVRGPSLHP